MFCPKCGYQLPEQGRFCPNCGWGEQQTPAGGGRFINADTLRAAFSSQLFLIMTILVTAGAVLSLVSSSFNLFAILFSISLWLLYASATSEKAPFEPTGMKMNYGFLMAIWIILWVCVGLLFIGGLIVMFISSAIPYFFSSVPYFNIFTDYSGLTVAVSIAIGFLLILISCAMAFINIFCFYNAYKFARSLYACAFSGGCAVKARTVRIWMLVVGIIDCLSIFTAFGSINAFIAAFGTICIGVAMICSSKLIQDYFE